MITFTQGMQPGKRWMLAQVPLAKGAIVVSDQPAAAGFARILKPWRFDVAVGVRP